MSSVFNQQAYIPIQVGIPVNSLLSKCCIEVGIVVSGSTASYVPMQFYKKAEPYALEEQLVVIKDDSIQEGLFFGVIRRVTKYEPLVKDKVRTPFVDRPEIMDPSLLMPYTTATIRLYGFLNMHKKALSEVTQVATPGSKVYVIKDGSFLGDYVRPGSRIIVGSHKYSGWQLPLDPTYAQYHIGVFGATGMGKSRLIRALIDELAGNNYRLVVFDHSGADYAPYYRDYVIGSKSIAISPPTIASVLATKARLPWQSYGEYLDVAVLSYVMSDERGQLGERRRGVIKWSKQEFLRHLRGSMSRLNARESTVQKAQLFIDYFVDDEFFDELNKRVVKPEDIVKSSIERGIAVVDLSQDTDLAVKQAIVADVIESAWDMVKHRQIETPARLIFVIDEAQNYVPEDEWTICKDAVETTSREGRKWGLSLILASQRMARDIASNIRANLGTVFFSRLPTQGDLRELGGYMDLADVNDSTIMQLGQKEFFVAGLMNPLRKPILIKVKEVA